MKTATIPYAIGSDKKTVRLAKEACERVGAEMSAGNFDEAGRLIDVFLSSPNRPFRAEFLHQSEVFAA